MKGIVVSKHPYATQAGIDALKAGGNAFDAAVSIGFTISVVEPYMSGIGGGKFQLVFRQANGQSGFINSPVICPSGAKPDTYVVDPKIPRGLFGFSGVKDQENEIGHRSVAIPGVLKGLCSTLERFGTMSLSDVIAPAIEHAERGFPLSWIDVGVMGAFQNRIKQNIASAQIYFPQGKMPSPTMQYPMAKANCLVQKDLAKSLKKISEQGEQVFYEGEIAELILKEMAPHGPWVIRTDLEEYMEELSLPISISYHDSQLLTGPDFQVFEALKILEHFDLASIDQNCPQRLHLIASACLLAHADFYHYLTSTEGDSLTIEKYLSEEYIKKQVARIPIDSPIGNTLFPKEEIPGRDSAQKSADPFTTTGYTCADMEGNIVSVLQTHGHLFGSCVTVPGTGILLNDQMLGFNPEPGTITSVSPGCSRPIPGWPIIGKQGSDSFFTVASPGGNRVLCALVQVISNILDCQMSISEALSAPRIDCGSTCGSRNMILADDKFPKGTLNQLLEMGYEVDVTNTSPFFPGGSPYNFAHPCGLSVDFMQDICDGGNDPSVDGTFSRF